MHRQLPVVYETPKMNGITIAFLVFAFLAVSYGHPHGRVRSNMHPLQNMYRDLSCSCSCDDLGALVTLVRALEEKECTTATPTSNGSVSKAEDLIMNLVNALITLTTQALSRNNCHCPNQSGTNINPAPVHNGGSGYYGGSSNNPNTGYNGGSGYNHHNSGSSYSHSDAGMLNLDLLNPNKKDNVLDFDLAKQHQFGFGLEGDAQASQGSNSYYPNGRSANGANDEGLKNVNLNYPNKKNNEVDLGKQNVVDVGLDGGGSPPPQTATSNSNSSKGSNNNVDVSNPIQQNNIVEVDLAKQTVIGIGVGNKDGGKAIDKS